MSKSVLISILPEWVEKIASGEKTIEVRKTRPKLETPFKCFIYETYDKKYDGIGVCWEKGNTFEHACKKAIGEFICDRIVCSQAYFDSQGKNHLTNVFPEDVKKTCLTEYGLWNYIAGKAVKANEMYDGWLWHISELKIYNKPEELSEFCKGCNDSNDYMYGSYCSCCEKKNRLTRPPQSWCYVEEQE